MAAVKVVLPWSMWPIVPTLQCGFVPAVFAADGWVANHRHWMMPKLADDRLKLFNRKPIDKLLRTAVAHTMLRLRNKLHTPNNIDIIEIYDVYQYTSLQCL